MDESEKARAKEFRQLIEHVGWNQSEAGREIGVTSNFINMIVNGKAFPSEALLKHLRLRVTQIDNNGGRSMTKIQTLLDAIPVEHQESAMEAAVGAIKPFLKAFARANDRPLAIPNEKKHSQKRYPSLRANPSSRLK
jgi:hypothetical protein